MTTATLEGKTVDSKKNRTSPIPHVMRDKVEAILNENLSFMDSPVYRRKDIEHELFDVEQAELPPTSWYQPTRDDAVSHTETPPQLMSGAEERAMFYRFNYTKKRLSQLKRK